MLEQRQRQHQHDRPTTQCQFDYEMEVEAVDTDDHATKMHEETDEQYDDRIAALNKRDVEAVAPEQKFEMDGGEVASESSDDAGLVSDSE